jgi:pyruvate carboxylase
MYPKVWEEYDQFRSKYDDVWYVPTLPFLYGLNKGEHITVTISPGKDLLITLINVSDDVDELGQRTVTFELNGQLRTVVVPDEKIQAGGGIKFVRKAEAAGEVGAPMPGRIGKVMVKPGQAVEAGQPLFTLEAMKMESTITAPAAGKVTEVGHADGDKVEAKQWVLTIG